LKPEISASWFRVRVHSRKTDLIMVDLHHKGTNKDVAVLESEMNDFKLSPHDEKLTSSIDSDNYIYTWDGDVGEYSY
jgi:hypothetical protein